MSLRVIGGSLGRTGTLSLKRALETLGIAPCLHMSDLSRDPGLCIRWQQSLSSGHPDWKQLLVGYGAAVDWPCCLYIESILRAFPEAKVIFTERDFDSWYMSLSETILPGLRWAQQIPDQAASPFIRLVKQVVAEQTFQGHLDRASQERIYRQHRQQILATVPRPQLLVLNLAQGWDPLCKFLGRAVPSVPFPNINTKEEFLHTVRGR